MATTVEWRGHTIKAALIGGKPAAQVLLGDRRAGDRRFGGKTVDEAVEAARAWIDQKHEASVATRPAAHIAAPDEYGDFFTAHPSKDKERAMLLAHSIAGVMTPAQLSAAAGWSSPASATSHYSKLGKAVADTLGLTIPPRADGTVVWTEALATDEAGPDDKLPRWRLHAEVVEGLRKAGIVP